MNHTKPHTQTLCLLFSIVAFLGCTDIPEELRDDAEGDGTCGNSIHNPSTSFCYNGSVYAKCDGLKYNPTTQICQGIAVVNAVCGGSQYNPLELGCCGSAVYNPSYERCLGNVVETPCGTSWYNSTQFCSANNIYDKCGGESYSLSSQRCQNGIVETKCGTNGWYNAANADLRCQSSIVQTKCGSDWYNPASQRCENNIVETKCGSEWYNASNANLRCQSSVIETRCGSGWYNPASQRCENNVVETKCGSGWYNSAQFCYGNSKIGNFCGTRTETFDPDLYECKPNSNGIYLKTPVSYGEENYDAVLIGDQVWMARNLNYNASGSKCYGEGGQVDDDERITVTLSNAEIQANCAKYGRLYDWSTAMGISSSYNRSSYNPSASTKYRGVCPTGWHLPNIDEWDVLLNDASYSSTKLKSASGWNDYNGSSGNGTDDYGFSALPGGYGNSDGGFGSVGNGGLWWSASEDNSYNAYRRSMYYYDEDVYYGYDDKGDLFSVRCVQD